MKTISLISVICFSLTACPDKQKKSQLITTPTTTTKSTRTAPALAPHETDKPKASINPLKQVKYWAYQIQHLDRNNAVSKLVKTTYDMLVLEPTRTDKDNAEFDSKGMVDKLHATKGKSGKSKIVIAYIDIGEAESWRYYWKDDWKKPTKRKRGKPDFLIIPDPDGWEDNYPVAFWDKRWKDIIIYDKDSMLNQILDDGYDGIYLDWVEAYSNDKVKQACSKEGKDSAVEMIAFIKEMRIHTRKRNPGFLIIAQNAAALAVGHPAYFKVIDAIAQEQIYYDGSADTKWNDPKSCDRVVPKRGDGYSHEFYQKQLRLYQQAGLPVFNVEYACSKKNVKEAYRISAKQNYVPYVTRRPLSRLTSDLPPGY